jgi:glycosyltransferase involved in cell wall biosynthesis
VADEIIVVDDFSSDDTVQLCRQEGAIVQQQSWLGFGPQKNLGIGMAAHDYILSLDADEALDEELKASIVAAKQKGLQGLYEFTRSNFYYGKFLRHGFEYPDFKIRLFPKMGVRWNDDKVHENLIVDNTLTTSRLKGHLLHYTYLFIHEHVSKANKYTSLAADNYKASGKKTSWFKIIFSPLFTFIQAFLFKRGFLDGKHGFVLAILHAHGTFLKYIKLWELNKNKSGNEK